MHRLIPRRAIPEPPVLGVALEFLRQLWAVDHGLAQVSKRMERSHGVTGPQRLAVRIISKRPGIGPAEIAALLHVDRGAATGLLQRLHRKGLVRRTQDTVDARRWHLTLTPAGRRIDRVDRGTIEATVRLVLESSTPAEIAASSRVMVRLAHALNSARRNEVK
jgi:MarR family transcriptional regulator, organic hydroperoxide resistance regulator